MDRHRPASGGFSTVITLVIILVTHAIDGAKSLLAAALLLSRDCDTPAQYRDPCPFSSKAALALAELG
jgi:hypothetical protein